MCSPFSRCSKAFDGVVQGAAAVIGFVLRDCTANVIYLAGRPPPPYSVPFAELVTAWEGITSAMLPYHVTQLWVEDDSALIVILYHC